MKTIRLYTDKSTPIPAHDFCRQEFDNSQFFRGSLETLYIILSTPRCGSTWLCSEIYRHTGLVVHEYLQSHQYLPYLADRFQTRCPNIAVKGGPSQINLPGYFQCLAGWRAKSGVLGINAHIEHLPLLTSLITIYKQQYPLGSIKIDYLYRQDKYAQAASHAIAHQTRCWSKTADPEIQHGAQTMPSRGKRLGLYLRSAKSYIKIDRNHALIQQIARDLDIDCSYCYEELKEHGAFKTVSAIADRLDLEQTGSKTSGAPYLAAQSSEVNGIIAAKLKTWKPIFIMVVEAGSYLQKALDLPKRLFRQSKKSSITIEIP